MNNFKRFIIHLLGGCTKQEYLNLEKVSFADGRLASMILAKQHADSLNGLSGDAWASEMYMYIVDDIKSLKMM